MPLLKSPHSLIVPTLVIFEVTRRAKSIQGESYAKSVLLLMRKAIIIEATDPIAVTAVDVSIQYKLSTADALIYATALEYDATLWTQDKHFQGLPHVEYFEKTA